MILYINEAFCDMYEEEQYLNLIKFYDLISIQYKTGYKFKICIQEQKICLDEYTVNKLFDIWPLMNISWGGHGGDGCELSLNINGIKSDSIEYKKE